MAGMMLASPLQVGEASCQQLPSPALSPASTRARGRSGLGLHDLPREEARNGTDVCAFPDYSLQLIGHTGKEFSIFLWSCRLFSERNQSAPRRGGGVKPSRLTSTLFLHFSVISARRRIMSRLHGPHELEFRAIIRTGNSTNICSWHA